MCSRFPKAEYFVMHSLYSVNIILNFKIQNKIDHTCEYAWYGSLWNWDVLFQCLIWPPCRPPGLGPTHWAVQSAPQTGKPAYSTLQAIHQFFSSWSLDKSCQLVITFGYSLPRLFNTHVNLSFINCSNAYLL